MQIGFTNNKRWGKKKVYEESSRSRRITTGNRSTKNAFVSVQIHFHCWNSSAINNLPCFDLRNHGWNSFLHMISLNISQWNSIRKRERKENESISLLRITSTATRFHFDGKEKSILEKFSFLGESKKRKKTHDEENGIWGFSPNGGIDGVFDFPRERVLV